MRIVRAFFLLTMLLTPLPSHGAAPVQIAPNSGFVPNQGQAPAEVLFYAAVPRGALYLTRDAIILDTWETERTRPLVERSPSLAVDDTTHRRGRAVWLRFSGAKPGALVEGESRGGSRLNFLMGNDPSRWHVDVPTYERVSYRELWPGIDLVLASGANGIRCALRAAPGSNPERVRFDLDEGAGTIRSRLDVAAVSAWLAGDAIPALRDNASALLWSTFLGGSAEEIGWSAALDSQGHAIVTGLDTSTFFPTTPGAYDEIYSGLGDVFVSKISADGSELMWSTFLGGDSLYFDYGYSVTVDGSDNPIVTGYTRNVDYPVTDGAYDTQHNGEADVFVTKLNSTGSDLVWSTFLGGDQHDIGYDLDLDGQGNPVVAGRTLSGNFPATSGAFDTDANGEEDAFIAKLSASGDELLWSTFLGGSLYEGVQGVRLDAAGAPLVCGYTASIDFPGGRTEGLYDIFVAKLSPDGSALPWAVLVGGGSYDYGTDLALDSQGNPVICGSTGSPDFPVTRGAYDETYNGDDDVVAAKLLNADGSLLWATFVGGSAPVYEIAQGIVMGAGDRPILAGATPSPDFPTTPDAFDRSHNGASDAFVLRLSPTGSALEWSSFFGGPGDDYAFELAKGRSGVVVTGEAGEGFPVTAGAFDPSYNGDISDVFVARIALMSTGPRIAGEEILPDRLALSIAPNPVVSDARVSFDLPSAAPTTVEIFDVMGRLCARLHDGSLEAGAHTLDWKALASSGRRLPSGVYAVRVTAGHEVQSRRVVLVR